MCAFVILLACGVSGPHGVAADTEPPTLQWELTRESMDGDWCKSNGTATIGARLEGRGALVGSDQAQALVLDGVSTRLVVESATLPGLLPRRALTIESWVQIQKVTDWGAMVGYIQDNGGFEQGWLLGYRGQHFALAVATHGAQASEAEGDGKLTYLVAPRPYALGRWHHVVGVYDGQRMRLYVDGEMLDESDEQSGDLLYPDEARFALGAYLDNDEAYNLPGMLHAVAVWPRALSPAEIQQRYLDKRDQVAGIKSPEIQTTPVDVGPIVRMTARDQASVLWRDASLANEPTTAAAAATDTATEHLAVEFGLGPLLDRRAVVDVSAGGREVARQDAGAWYVTRLTDLQPPGDVRFRIQNASPPAAETFSPTYRFDSWNCYLPPRAGVPRDAMPVDKEIADAVQQILQLSGWRSGYALVLGGGAGGQLAYALSQGTDLQVTIVEPDAERAQGIRTRLAEAGLYGGQINVHVAPLNSLPYVDYVANLVISPGVVRGETYQGDTDEALRVVRPAGGCAFLTADHLRRPHVREELAGAGRWTHQYGEADNTACSKDDRVRGDVLVQWWGPPGPRPMPDRGGRNPSPLAVDGFLFTQGDRILFGQDAYNGWIYWSMMVPDMRRSNIPRDCGNMAAAGDALYVAVNGHCLVIDPRSGGIRHVFPVRSPVAAEPAADDVAAGRHGTNRNAWDWGYIGYQHDTLIGTAVAADAAYVADAGEWYEDYVPAQIDKVVSPLLFALNRHTGEEEWRYARGAILQSTLTVGPETVYFVESRNAAARQSGAARQSHSVLQEQQFLVALDRQSGELQWDRPVDLSACEFMTYMAVAGDMLLVSGTDKDKVFHHFGFRATSGELAWSRRDSTAKTHHSGHLDHMVVIGDRIYSNLHVMDLQTGRDVGPVYAERRGCGIMAGSNHMLFFRDHFHSMWDLKSGKRWEFPGIRSGCWLGIVPAGGIVLAPESSSGCGCTHAVQTSVGFRPVADGLP